MEVSLLLPVMLIILFGAMDLSRVFYAGIAVASSARAGAQWGTLHPGNAGLDQGIITAAKNDVQLQGIDPAAVTVTPTRFCRCVGTGATVACATGVCDTAVSGTTLPSNYLEVKVQYNFRTLVNWIRIPRNTPITRRATMRYQ